MFVVTLVVLLTWGLTLAKNGAYCGENCKCWNGVCYTSGDALCPFNRPQISCGKPYKTATEKELKCAQMILFGLNEDGTSDGSGGITSEGVCAAPSETSSGGDRLLDGKRCCDKDGELGSCGDGYTSCQQCMNRADVWAC